MEFIIVLANFNQFWLKFVELLLRNEISFKYATLVVHGVTNNRLVSETIILVICAPWVWWENIIKEH